MDGHSCDVWIMGSCGVVYKSGWKHIPTDNVTPSSLHSWCHLSFQAHIAPIRCHWLVAHPGLCHDETVSCEFQ